MSKRRPSGNRLKLARSQNSVPVPGLALRDHTPVTSKKPNRSEPWPQTEAMRCRSPRGKHWNGSLRGSFRGARNTFSRFSTRSEVGRLTPAPASRVVIREQGHNPGEQIQVRLYSGALASPEIMDDQVRHQWPECLRLSEEQPLPTLHPLPVAAHAGWSRAPAREPTSGETVQPGWIVDQDGLRV